MDNFRYITALLLIVGGLWLVNLLLRRRLNRVEMIQAPQADDKVLPPYPKWLGWLSWQKLWKASPALQNRRMRLVETLPLDPKRRLVVVEYRGQEIILLLGPQNDRQITLPPKALSPFQQSLQNEIKADHHALS